jgi:nucleoid-associated protein YgaU
LSEVRAAHEGLRGEVEQPGGDDAAAPPDLGDVAEVEVVLVVLGVAQRRRLRVLLVALVGLADIRLLQDVEASA